MNLRLKYWYMASAVIMLLLCFSIGIDITNQPEETSSLLINTSSSPSVSSPVIETTPSVFRGWIINRMGYSYLYNDRALLQFNGTVKTAERYADILNGIAKSLKNENTYSITVPTQVEFLEIPVSVMAQDNFYCTSQQEAQYALENKLENIENIDIISVFQEHSDEYLFFRTDYNWTATAAYYAYTQFCSRLNLTPVPLNAYETVSLDNYLGWFYTATQSEVLLDNADTIVYYRTETEYPCYITVEENGYKTYVLKYSGTNIEKSNGYDVFIGPEREIKRFETRAKGGSLLIIGDTSAHTFIPFLTAHFGEIIFYNPNCFSSESNYNLPQTDYVLFMNYATNAHNAAYCGKLEGFMQ